MTNSCIFGSKSVIFIFYIFSIVFDFNLILYDQNPYKIKSKILNLQHYFKGFKPPIYQIYNINRFIQFIEYFYDDLYIYHCILSNRYL